MSFMMPLAQHKATNNKYIKENRLIILSSQSQVIPMIFQENKSSHIGAHLVSHPLYQKPVLTLKYRVQ